MPAWTSQTNVSNHDANEGAGGSVYLTDASPTITTALAWLGIHLSACPIEQGDIVNPSYLEIYVHSSDDDIHFRIHAENVDHATVFTTGANDISNRSRTSAYVDWDVNGAGVGWAISPDISSLFQAIINRGGYSRFNDVNLIVECTSDISLELRMYDYSGNAYGPRATVDYTPAVRAIPLIMRHYRNRRG